jgi:hypothetical protein
MQKAIIITQMFIFLLSFNTQAQLLGSGKVITRNFEFKDFDKLNIQDFDGQIEVEIGKPFSIKIEIDENLEPRLNVNKDSEESQLNVSLDGNTNGKLYLENTRIKIMIGMPEASVVKHRGNTTLKIKGIAGRYFRLENVGNGDALLEGSIDELDIRKTGNGNVLANKLTAKTTKVKSAGNGNVTVNSQITLHANGTGNGSIFQKGPGKVDPLSGVVGNGEVKKMKTN